MYSRAYILLERELQKMQNYPSEGVTAFPVSEDLMNWEAKIEGLENSIWEGFVFDLTIDFTPEYNLVPPVVKFLTIPFHPNVDPYTGQPSLDFLDSHDNWNRNYTLSSILLALQVLLSNPILENPVNLEAAQLLIKNESMYKAVIQRLSQPAQRQRLKEGSLKLTEEPQERFRIIKKISFNDYYKTWSEIATSKTAEHSKNPFFGDPNFMGQYYKWKRQDLQQHKQWKLKLGLTKLRFDRESKSPEHSSNYFAQRMVVIPTPTEVSYDSVESESRFYESEQEWNNGNWAEEIESNESWEEEVDSLVAWTNALDVDSLDYEN